MNKWQVYKSVGLRPFNATQMLWKHRRTLRYLWDKRGEWGLERLYNHVFVTYFVRGEDCGKGVLDPIWKLTGWAPFLWDLEMETTTKCYGKCIHCEHTYWKDKSYLNWNLGMEEFVKVLDSCPNLKWINLTGEGTSVLNPDFRNMVKEVKSRGIYLDFSHDFARLDDEDAELWVQAGVDRIYWSIDGCTKETYEKVRPGFDFEKVQGNVQKLITFKKKHRSPLPEICFRYTFFKDNVHEVRMLPGFLTQLVSGNLGLYGDEPSINIVALLEFKETRGWEVEIDPIDVESVDYWCGKLGFKVYWSHVTHIEEEKAPMDYCTFWSEPYIMKGGYVVPCCAVLMSNRRGELEELAFGNINEKSLREIWYSEGYRRFRKMVVNPRAPVPKVCLGCRAFETKLRAQKYGVR